MSPSCFLLDLDDTLYAEPDYVFSGYRAVAAVLADKHGLGADAVAARLRYEFLKFGRTGAFDRLYKALRIVEPPVRDLVAAYRAHRPEIALYPGAAEAMAALRRVAPVAIVTDGDGAMQRAKVEALGLSSLVDAVVLCWEHAAPKPAPDGFRMAAERMGADPAAAWVIGDDPFHDTAAARALGAKVARVRTGRLATLESPADLLPDLEAADLPSAVRALAG